MTSPIKLRFDPKLPHQVAAIEAVTRLFADGLQSVVTPMRLGGGGDGRLDIVAEGLANATSIPDEDFDAALLGRLKAIQRANGLEVSETLNGRNFTIEMETGTGKTYVYLRTIFELHQQYGLSKFVIVVPSVPIREGVIASLRSIGPQLAQAYGVPFDPAIDGVVYNSARPTDVRQFATASSLQILVLNLQTFQKEAVDDPTKGNVINRPNERMGWRAPIEFVQAVRPIVVIDEPQNFESEKSKEALARLNPLATLRYSATPKNPYNLLHRLGPVDAFQQGLVKQIEVEGVAIDAGHAANTAYIRLLKVDAAKKRAQLEINHGVGAKQTLKSVWVKRGDDLFEKSARCQAYIHGFIVEDILSEPGHERVEFDTGEGVSLGAAGGDQVAAVQRLQIAQTIKYHLERELVLRERGIKVLSLFFLDQVADYRIHQDATTWTLGPVGIAFQEEFAKLIARPKYASLDLPPVEELHNGYFSLDAKKRPKDSRGTGEGDASAYELIMRSKEELLSESQPLRFIFTHSALREGWDNPNVFQICTLTHQRSAITRRQQIGRGLRLPVNQQGERVLDLDIARLTVIANEAYEEFAAGLQTEYEKDAGQTWGTVERRAFAQIVHVGQGAPTSSVQAELGVEQSALVWEHLVEQGILDGRGRLTAAFAPSTEGFVLPMPPQFASCADGVLNILERYARPIVRDAKREKRRIRIRKGVVDDGGFVALWNDIARRTRYRVKIDSEQIVRDAVSEIDGMPAVPKLHIRSERVALEIDASGIRAGSVTDGARRAVERPAVLPDILLHLQNETDLTRVTLRRILLDCGRIDEFERNPHAFMVEVARVIKRVLANQVTDGISYEPDGSVWEMRQLTTSAIEEIERYTDRLYEVQSDGKSPFSDIEFDSSVERAFVQRLDEDARVRYFIKLPASFTIDTPVGPYNPDWAVCIDGDGGPALHLVSETKSTLEELGRRETENLKIRAARKHFDALGVNFGVDTSFDELLERAASE